MFKRFLDNFIAFETYPWTIFWTCLKNINISEEVIETQMKLGSSDLIRLLLDCDKTIEHVLEKQSKWEVEVKIGRWRQPVNNRNVACNEVNED